MCSPCDSRACYGLTTVKVFLDSVPITSIVLKALVRRLEMSEFGNKSTTVIRTVSLELYVELIWGPLESDNAISIINAVDSCGPSVKHSDDHVRVGRP